MSDSVIQELYVLHLIITIEFFQAIPLPIMGLLVDILEEEALNSVT